MPHPQNVSQGMYEKPLHNVSRETLRNTPNAFHAKHSKSPYIFANFLL